MRQLHQGDIGLTIDEFFSRRPLGRLRNGDASTKTLVSSIARRSSAFGLSGYGERAAAALPRPSSARPK